MFKVGDLVKFTEKFSNPGEENYIHEVMEVNPDTGRILISTLNSLLTLGSSEAVTAEMIRPAAKYEVIFDRNASDRKYLVTDTTTKMFFIGYDFMGSVDWTADENQAFHMDKDDDPWQIAKDLQDAE